jgi:hypothetical protein
MPAQAIACHASHGFGDDTGLLVNRTLPEDRSSTALTAPHGREVEARKYWP